MENRIFKTIIFDLDGTLTDSAPGILNSAMYALEKMGIDDIKRESLYSFIGPPLMDSFRAQFQMSEEDARKSVNYYREYYRNKGVLEVALYPGMKEVLAALKEKGYCIMMGTSKPEVFANQIANHLEIDSYFDLIAGANLEGTRDQKVDVLKYGLEKIGTNNPAEILMVGDRKFDVLGAKKLSIDTLGVLYGYGNREELQKAGAKWIVESPVEILEFLERGDVGEEERKEGIKTVNE
ncbi:MAG: HAD hydrolase-like protein [Eubacterium sp.]|nr:HAD hydrolase-like protein [Eubacterium sp.]